MSMGQIEWEMFLVHVQPLGWNRCVWTNVDVTIDTKWACHIVFDNLIWIVTLVLTS
jgi:hypothetical protein